MPDRMIRDRCRRSPSLQRLSDAAERAWWRLTVGADDYGRFEADGEVLLSMLFIRRPSGWTPAKMAKVILEWAAPGPPDDPDPLVHLYRVEGDLRVYGHAPTFLEHQRERESKPKYPDPPCGGLPQDAAKCRDSLQLAASSPGFSSPSAVDGLKTTPPPPPPGGPEAASSANGWGSPEALMGLYNTLTPDECPAVKELTPGRVKKAKAYLTVFRKEEFWRRAFGEVHRSRFLRGLKPSPGHENFVFDFDWMLTKGRDGSENIVKVAEGKYRDKGA